MQSYPPPPWQWIILQENATQLKQPLIPRLPLPHVSLPRSPCSTMITLKIKQPEFGSKERNCYRAATERGDFAQFLYRLVFGSKCDESVDEREVEIQRRELRVLHTQHLDNRFHKQQGSGFSSRSGSCFWWTDRTGDMISIPIRADPDVWIDL